MERVFYSKSDVWLEMESGLDLTVDQISCLNESEQFTVVQGTMIPPSLTRSEIIRCCTLLTPIKHIGICKYENKI